MENSIKILSELSNFIDLNLYDSIELERYSIKLQGDYTPEIYNGYVLWKNSIIETVFHSTDDHHSNGSNYFRTFRVLVDGFSYYFTFVMPQTKK